MGAIEDSAQYQTHRFTVFVDAPDRGTAMKALGRALADNNNCVALDPTRCMVGMMISDEERKLIPDHMNRPMRER
jgi:hypothetical protein